MKTKIRAADMDGREDDQGHPPRRAQSSFGRGQNPYVLEGLRGEDRIAVLRRRCLIGAGFVTG